MLTVSRSSTGQYRWYAAPAATAFLNRTKEIDSIRLFDNFIARIERGARYPFLTFWHQGEALRMGQADHIERVGKSLILSGTWDETPIGNAARSTIERSTPGEWGTSIRYFAYSKEDMIIIRANGDVIHSPVYTDGVLDEVSILPEVMAADIQTNMISRGVTMQTIILRSGIVERGGPGSGFTAEDGHKGIPGHQGGSQSGGGGGSLSDSSSESGKKSAPVSTTPNTDYLKSKGWKTESWYENGIKSDPNYHGYAKMNKTIIHPDKGKGYLTMAYNIQTTKNGMYYPEATYIGYTERRTDPVGVNPYFKTLDGAVAACEQNLAEHTKYFLEH